MTPEELANVLQPVQEAGIDVAATAAAALMASVISAYRDRGEEHQIMMMEMIVQKSWQFYHGAAERERKIKAALVEKPGSVH